MPRKDPVAAKEYWDAYRVTDKCREKQARWREKHRAYRQSEEGKDVYYDSNLRRLYGITIDDYRALVLSQDGRCAICKRHQDEIKEGHPRKLCVDHCHVTGKVRGLLCAHCNHAIGKFDDSVQILKSAIDYLSRQPGGSQSENPMR